MPGINPDPNPGQDPGLARFLDAQDGVYGQALQELAAGEKRSHWIWFIFPQLAVLGRSSTARYYGLAGLEEARQYARHPVLGARLRECAATIAALRGKSAHQVLGSPDDLKLCSCMTLFELAEPTEPVFAEVLARFYGGRRDPLTLDALGLPRAS